MTDRFEVLPIEALTEIILSQWRNKNSIFEIPQSLFFYPKKEDPFRMVRFGQRLETPLGVAAGPHTQLAQNIIAAWLTGARFIELKTVQTLDELEVSKPCIDMQDEGYNCEWSQELKMHQSFDQYLDAWILIHILKRELGHDLSEPGLIFNMSVGYDYEGIMKENVQWFLSKMNNASKELAEKINRLRTVYPAINTLNISPHLSNNITLSTMHGCPPDEIEKIGRYLLKEKRLHTTVKLNPTLLGKEKLHRVIRQSGFDTLVPDMAFAHDLKYPEAVQIIKNLQKEAKKNNLFFGLKLTNTLESQNNKDVFPAKEKMMYMSGRALHPLSVNLAAKLQNDFQGKLDISFSGGADALNTPDLIASGLMPVTVCSDILKPGGYGRLFQYIDVFQKRFSQLKAANIPEFIAKKSGLPRHSLEKQQLHNLTIYAAGTLTERRYKKTNIHAPSIKTQRPLGTFDCIHAPCVDTCPTHQDIPDYLYHTAHGNFDKAFEVIIQTNPFPNTTGMVCDHLCTTKCTRINYDTPLQIREIKRFVAEYAVKHKMVLPVKNRTKKSGKVSVIGAGPSGLTCARFLAEAGFEVDVYESKKKPGGMVSGAIPSFRLTGEALYEDMERIEKAGVKIHYNTLVDSTLFEQLRKNSRFVYLATGAQKSRKLALDGIDKSCVMDPLDFLFKVKAKQPVAIGKRVAIIGGGNTAMDAARTAYRLIPADGEVTVLYRRRIQEMPADQGEIAAVMEEGVQVQELVSPVAIKKEAKGRCTLVCEKMKPGKPDSSGRAHPNPIAGSEFEQMFDTIIPAIGQDLAIDFVEPSKLRTKSGSYETLIENLFIGGDALRGASTAINAIGDGRKAAALMIEKAGMEPLPSQLPQRKPLSLNEHRLNRVLKTEAVALKESPLSQRKNFNLVSGTFTEEEAVKEASRCLLCDEVCNVCTTVCPNVAFHSYETSPHSYPLQKICVQNGKVEILKDIEFRIEQKHQILHLADWCNECGNCTTFCPTAGSPYREKPHLYFTKESFEKNHDGYFFDKDKRKLISNRTERLLSLSDKTTHFHFSAPRFELDLHKKTLEIIRLEVKEKCTFDASLREAAEMSILLQGALSFYGLK